MKNLKHGLLGAIVGFTSCAVVIPDLTYAGPGAILVFLNVIFWAFVGFFIGSGLPLWTGSGREVLKKLDGTIELEGMKKKLEEEKKEYNKNIDPKKVYDEAKDLSKKYKIIE